MDKIGKTTLNIMREVSWYNEWLFSFLEPFIKGNILEVGAGIGNFTSLLLKKGKVFAIDMNRGYVEKLKKFVRIGVVSGFGDIEKGKYFFQSKRFDTIVCLNVLEHIGNDKKAIKNMYKLLKNNGNLILLVPAHDFAYGTLDAGLDHFRRYDKKTISELLKGAGFKLEKVRYLNFPGLIGWFVNSKLLKKEILPKNQLIIFDRLARIELLIERYLEPPIGLSVLAIARR